MPNITYTIKAGDTLAKIAAAYKTTAGAIAKQNGITDPNKIKVGQRLTIATATGAAAPVTTKPAPVPTKPQATSKPAPVGTSAGITAESIKALRDAIAKIDGANITLAKMSRSKMTQIDQATYDGLLVSGKSLRATASKVLGVSEVGDGWVQRAATAINDLLFASRDKKLGIGAVAQITAAGVAAVVAATAAFVYAVGFLYGKYNDKQAVVLKKEVFDASKKAGATDAEARANAETVATPPPAPEGSSNGPFSGLSDAAKYGAFAVGALLLMAVASKAK